MHAIVPTSGLFRLWIDQINQITRKLFEFNWLVNDAPFFSYFLTEQIKLDSTLNVVYVLVKTGIFKTKQKKKTQFQLC